MTFQALDILVVTSTSAVSMLAGAYYATKSKALQDQVTKNIVEQGAKIKAENRALKKQLEFCRCREFGL